MVIFQFPNCSTLPEVINLSIFFLCSIYKLKLRRADIAPDVDESRESTSTTSRDGTVLVMQWQVFHQKPCGKMWKVTSQKKEMVKMRKCRENSGRSRNHVKLDMNGYSQISKKAG